MGLKAVFEGFVDGVYVADNRLCVSICGVFAFDNLEMSFPSGCRVFDELTNGPNGVSHNPY